MSDPRSDEQLVEAAHKYVDNLKSRLMQRGTPNDPITALGKRLLQRSEEKQAAEDVAAHAQSLVAPVVSGVLELDSFLRHRGRP